MCWKAQNYVNFGIIYCQKLSDTKNDRTRKKPDKLSVAFAPLCHDEKTIMTQLRKSCFGRQRQESARKRRENIAPVPFWLTKLVRAWKVINARVLARRKVCPPYAINCQHFWQCQSSMLWQRFWYCKSGWWGKVLVKSQPTSLAPDAGAMPRTAAYLVNGKGLGQPRQRRWSRR